MIRTREESFVVEQAPRDAYVAGMKNAGTRTLTARETRLLQWQAYGGLVLGVVAGVALPELFRRGPWAEGATFWSTLLLIAAVVAFLASLVFVGPALRTLRAGYVFLYRGAVRPLGAFDGNQVELFGNKPAPDEIVVMADRRTVFQVDGTLQLRPLPLMRPSFVAGDRGPDTRPLSELERRELREISRGYLRLNLPALLQVISSPMAMLVVARRMGLLERWGEMPFVVVAVALIAIVVAAHWSPFRFARRLRKDLAAGTLADGRLASGVPWLSEGDVATWRLARPRTSLFLDVKALLKL
ncbi:MAG: hypothetical protein ACO1SV_20235 [Fimbriimonas sp.]